MHAPGAMCLPPFPLLLAPPTNPSVHFYALSLELFLRLFDLSHELVVRFRDVVEGEYAVAQLEQ